MWKNEIINPQFIFHADFIQELPEQIAKEWIMYILRYGLCGVEPTFEDIIYSELWRKIKERIDFNKRSYERKCEYQREYKQRKAAEKGVIQNIPNNSEHSETFGIIQNIPLELHSNTNSNSKFKSKFKSNTNTNTNTNTDVCDKRDFFLSLWNKNADVLGIAQAIERPNDFDAYFNNESVTKETIEKGITHFVEAVKSGKLQKRFIPATPDRFILKNTLERFQEPMTDKSKSVIYDADHRGEFQEVEQA